MHYTLASPYLIQNVFKGNFEIITQPPARSIYIYWELEKLAIWKNSNENMHLKILIRYNLGFLKNKDGAFLFPWEEKILFKTFYQVIRIYFSSPMRIQFTYKDNSFKVHFYLVWGFVHLLQKRRNKWVTLLK